MSVIMIVCVSCQWSPDSAEVAVGRTTLVDTVPMGYGRPRGDATTCPMDESMTSRPTVIEPGSAGRGGGGWVILVLIFFSIISQLSSRYRPNYTHCTPHSEQHQQQGGITLLKWGQVRQRSERNFFPHLLRTWGT